MNFSPVNIGIKPGRYGSSNVKPKPPRPSPGLSHQPPRRPCTLCTTKGFQSDHFPLNFNCGVAKLSSPDILKLISNNKVALAAPIHMTLPSNVD